jgi:hypothetical protein
MFKVFGYDSSWGPTSTGTSQPNKLCLTGGMDSCIAVAIGGTSADRARAKIRVFHVMAGHDLEQAIEHSEAIDDHISQLREQGFKNISAAMHGGPIGEIDQSTDDAEIYVQSNLTAEKVKSALDSRDVAIAFNETCGQRNSSTSLGAIILPVEDGTMSVKFVTRALVPGGKVIQLLDE